MSPEIVERELIQARLLSSIFARTVKNQIALKGGAALRTVFGSQRATKDIDLAQDPTQSLASLQRLMNHAIADSTQGFLKNVVVTAPKQTQTVARWKIHGTTDHGTHIALTVEVSRRGIPTGAVVQQMFMPPTEARAQNVMIDVYSPEAMIASKVFALASDNRMAPRDLYDLDLLIRMKIQPDLSFFSTIEDKKAFVDQIWRKIDALTWQHFEQEVSPYLPDSVRSRIDAATFEQMQVRVGEHIESWLLGEGGGPMPELSP